MNRVERFRAVMNFQPVDRLPRWEWAMWWDETIADWKRQGLPAELESVFEIADYFGLDPYQQFWFSTTDDTIEAVQHHVEGIVSNMDDYLRLRPKFFPDHSRAIESMRPWAMVGMALISGHDFVPSDPVRSTVRCLQAARHFAPRFIRQRGKLIPIDPALAVTERSPRVASVWRPSVKRFGGVGRPAPNLFTSETLRPYLIHLSISIFPIFHSSTFDVRLLDLRPSPLPHGRTMRVQCPFVVTYYSTPRPFAMQISSIQPIIVAEDRNYFFVVVETDSGLRGVGEGGITWREKAMAGFVECLAPSLVGQDPMRTEHLWQVMHRCGFFPGGRIGAAATSAIDIALWDIKAQSLGVPLYQLLGGMVRDRVVCYGHIAAPTTEALVDAALKKMETGWQYVRFDIPSDGTVLAPRQAVRSGVQQFAALREALGNEVEIIIDVHTRLDLSDAVTLCRELEPLRPFFVEDPVRCENSGVLARLRQSTGVPVAMGEQYATKWEFREPLENDWIDFARIDVCNVGGVTEAMKVAHWCETHYVPIAPHNPLGPISTAACLHMDLAVSNFAVQECAREPGQVLRKLFPEQVPFEPGHMLPPTLPGLGVSIDLSAIGHYPPIPEGDCPRLHRPDNSFTNW